jgi:hypothetical protein
MHGIISPTPAGQAAPTLTDLAEAVRAARAAAAAAFANGLDHVREVGDRLKIAKQMAGHGRWGEFLKTCELNDRTARQYIQFAELAAKTAPGTDLTGLSIKAAIKLLSPSNASRATAAPKSLVIAKTAAKIEATPNKCGTHIAIIEAWLAASPTDRTKALDAIGLVELWAAIPPAWMPQLADCFANLAAVEAESPVVTANQPAQSTELQEATDRLVATISADLTVPSFLDQRPAPLTVEAPPPVAAADSIVPISEPVMPPPAPKTKPSPTLHRDPFKGDWRKLPLSELAPD